MSHRDNISKLLIDIALSTPVLFLYDGKSFFVCDTTSLTLTMMTTIDALHSQCKVIVVLASCDADHDNVVPTVLNSYNFGKLIKLPFITVLHREIIFMKIFHICQLKFDLEHTYCDNAPFKLEDFIRLAVKGLALKTQGYSVSEIIDVVSKEFQEVKCRLISTKSLLNTITAHSHHSENPSFSDSRPLSSKLLTGEVLIGLDEIKRRLLSSIYAPFKKLDSLRPGYSVNESEIGATNNGRSCSGLFLMILISYVLYLD